MVQSEVKFEMVKELEDEKFRRLAGIKRTTFDKMILILEQSNKDKKIKGEREGNCMKKFLYSH
jgi:hypothetical protein